MRSYPTTKQVANGILFCLFVQICFIPLPSHCAAPMGRKSATANITHSLRITKTQCVGTPYKLTRLNHCNMEQHQNGTINLNVSLTVPIVLNYIEITVKVFYKYTTYRPFMIDWNIELCQAYRLGKVDPSEGLVLKIIAETLPEYYYPCPHGNRTYVTAWLLDPKFIPKALPSGNYRLDIFFRESSKTVLFGFQLYGAMRKQGLVG
ncbi:uncharacterized protein LOC118504957 isoform X2 [Anopheles stephensi]|uniref:uncharacterized protein LOC118504957 isoform X2 n=1 Tax=Anopheles stephensi TaxID=30069 RepID=UPI0009B4F5BB|nr:uncharacterized protein LOC118504957 isoform X2 [Anopheles stephensi]